MKHSLFVCAFGVLTAAVILCGCNKKKTQIDPEKIYTSEEILKSLDYDPLKYATLNDYKNMDIKIPDVPAVTDDYVIAYIDYLLKEEADYVETDKQTAELGDDVNIDYSGSIDGKKFDGGTATSQYLKLGSGAYIDGFEDAIVGHKVGETFDINVTFPYDYVSEAVAGKAAVFEITLNGIYTRSGLTADQLTDAYVKEKGYADTVDEYKEKLKNELLSNNEYYIQEELRDNIQDTLVQNCEVTLPDSLNETAEDIKEEYKKKAEDQNKTFDDYLSDLGYDDADAMAEQIRAQREKSAYLDCIYQAIIKDTNLTVSGKDLSENMESIKNSTGQTEEEVLEMLGGFDEYLLSYAESQALENLIEHYRKMAQ